MNAYTDAAIPPMNKAPKVLSRGGRLNPRALIVSAFQVLSGDGLVGVRRGLASSSAGGAYEPVFK